MPGITWLPGERRLALSCLEIEFVVAQPFNTKSKDCGIDLRCWPSTKDANGSLITNKKKSCFVYFGSCRNESSKTRTGNGKQSLLARWTADEFVTNFAIDVAANGADDIFFRTLYAIEQNVGLHTHIVLIRPKWKLLPRDFCNNRLPIQSNAIVSQ